MAKPKREKAQSLISPRWSLSQHEAPKRVPRNAGFTICIYINDLSTYKAVQLTDLLTTAMVVQYFKRKGLLDQADDWALFEVANSHGVGKYYTNLKRKRRMKSSFIAEIYIYRETAPRLGDCTGYSSRVGRRYAQHVDAEKIPVQIIVDGRGECGSNDREHI